MIIYKVAMMRNSRVVLASIMLLMMLVLQGCGRKGPLFMPKPESAPPQTEQKN
jgi:predicted small lipoprotein YifL